MPSPINISGFVITFWLDLASGVVCFPQAIEIYAERFEVFRWLLISRIRIIMLDVGTASKNTVLIVDNQPREPVALQKQFAFAGFKTEIATTGAGAIKLVEEHPPDIVLIEASLSDIDSVEVVSFIRSHLRTCRLPVLAMSVLPI